MRQNQVKKTVERFIGALDIGSTNIAATLLLVIVIVNGLSVFFRYALGSPFSWSEEVMRYCNIWLSYIGAISAFIHNEHMKIDIFHAHTGWIGRAARLVGLIAISLVAVFMVWLGTKGAVANLRQFSPSAGIVMTIPYAAVPVAGLGILVASAYFIFASFSRAERALAQDDA